MLHGMKVVTYVPRPRAPAGFAFENYHAQGSSHSTRRC